MRIATWNINSIRSRSARLLRWLDLHEPDVALLQETKCSDVMFAERFAPALEAAGYQIAHHGHDHWNGVAILSRVGLRRVRYGMPGENRRPFDEARLISAECGGLTVHSVYAPNGRALDNPHYLYKLVWFERLRSAIDVSLPTVLAGDFNVAPTDADIYDPIRWRRKTHASHAERAAVEQLIDDGLVDVGAAHLDGPAGYTWWNYRPGQLERNRGLRIDLTLCTPDIAEQVGRVWVDRAERADDHPHEKPSDHAPVVLDW